VPFRDQLLATLRELAPVFQGPGAMVAGSEVPNLLEPNAASTLVVSQDVDVLIEIQHHAEIKERLREISGFEPSSAEPSVWLPLRPDLMEVNFIGADHERPGETYVFEDEELPLLVFGHLSLLELGVPVRVDGQVIPVPRLAGLLLEKLLTERSGEKGDRDLLVSLGLCTLATPQDLDELTLLYRSLQAEFQYAVRSNLSTLSLLEARPHMPDPGPHRRQIAGLLARLETT
jgi:hypothetical protein